MISISGSRYDAEGNVGDPGWWDSESRARFNEKAKGMIDQYNDYTYLGFHLNGFVGQGENIADNGGLRESYRVTDQTVV